jgi:amidase
VIHSSLGEMAAIAAPFLTDRTTRTWLESLFDYGPFTAVFNISGQPAISLPLAQSACDPPIGVQLVAPYGREDALFQVAAQLELMFTATPPRSRSRRASRCADCLRRCC